jgi:hypothetical protein
LLKDTGDSGRGPRAAGPFDIEVRNTEGTTMKRNALRFLPFLLAGACLLLAAKVTVDYNHNIDFSQYKTYSWLKADAADPLWPDRIRQAVDSQLTAKGWTKRRRQATPRLRHSAPLTNSQESKLSITALAAAGIGMDSMMESPKPLSTIRR